MNEQLSARQFIYASYSKWAEAIDNGYDIRADESGWLEMMEAYAQYKNRITNNYYLSAMEFVRKESEKYFPNTEKIHKLATEVVETNTITF
jgi:uncharacterized UPF0160 family protein